MQALPEELHKQITILCKEGDELSEQGRFSEAVGKYNTAWKLVPQPPNDWEASTWILTAIADSCFSGGYFTSAIEALEYALVCPDGAGNPFIRLRLGQCLFEKKRYEESAENLARAYMLQGKEIFENEDAKYFEFLKAKIEPPVSGEW